MGQYDPVIPRRVDGTAVVGQKGEITSNFDATQAYLHDGATPGGRPLIENVGAGLRRVNGLLLPSAMSGRVIVMGDSIVQQDSLDQNGVWMESSGWAELAINSSMTGMRFVRNSGIGGNKVEEMLARFDRDVLQYQPDVMIIMPGTNNLITGLDNAGYAFVMNTIETMVVQALQAGIAVFLVTPPVNGIHQLEPRIAMPWYHDLADYYGLPILNTYNITCDPLTGMYKDGWSPDQVHPNKIGMTAIGLAAAKMLAHPWNYIRRPYLASYAQELGGLSNMFYNGSFARQFVPGTPDNWALGASGGNFTQNARYPFSGVQGVITKTGDTGGEYLLFGTGLTDGFAPGDVLTFSGHVVTSGQADGVEGFTLGIQFEGSGDNAIPLGHLPYNTEFLFSQEIIVPANPGQMTPTLFALNDGVYQVSNFTLTNKTARAAIWKPGQLNL